MLARTAACAGISGYGPRGRGKLRLELAGPALLETVTRAGQ
jgi:hypothetical protein